MKKTLLILAAALAATPLFAGKNDKMEPWQDPNVFEENRLPMAATFVTDQQKTLTLNGVWKFNGTRPSRAAQKASRPLTTTTRTGARSRSLECGS